MRTGDDICKYVINFKDVVKKNVRSGNNTFFWLDNWTGKGIFKDKFPELYHLEKKKKCKVSDRIVPSGMTWEWKRNLSSAPLVNAMTALLQCIGDFRLCTNHDFWSCEFAPGGKFSVAAVREAIDRPVTQDFSFKFLWANEVPKNTACFVWRAKFGRIPSAEGLIKRGVHLHSSICGRCNSEIESVEHIFMHYKLSSEIFESIWRWCNLG